MKQINFMIGSVALVIVFTSAGIDVQAQNTEMESPATEHQVEEPQLSTIELIKLVTKAPIPERFSSEQEYFEAKTKWIEENPDAYAQMHRNRATSTNKWGVDSTFNAIDELHKE